jgi:retron-type reverse transcriptase
MRRTILRQSLLRLMLHLRRWGGGFPSLLPSPLLGPRAYLPGPDRSLFDQVFAPVDPESWVTLLFMRIANTCLSLGHWPSHFKESLSVIIPKPGKPIYSTPKSFRPIVLLNTLGKLIEKMLSYRLQFDGVAHGAFEPNQFGGIAQHSTEDAGVYLTHLVRAGWARGLQTSVVAFDIAQFFPSLNHNVLLDIISRLGFPVEMGPSFRSYLVGRRTTYRWDAFTSDPFAVDVGVGQGSALSPVLSALYLTLITRLFHASDIGQRVGLMSYVDDGTIIAQSARVEDNLAPLKEAYGWLFHAFTALGLVLEHDKSEAFHFSRARSFEGPAVDLGYAPFTGDTPLRPKAVWHYLGFFFDRKLQFKEHARFYTTRAFTMVRSMGMLGNSVRGLTPPQKRLLYRTCVVPIMTYGFHLWFFKGARVKGLVKAMSHHRFLTCYHDLPPWETPPTALHDAQRLQMESDL